MKKKGFTLVELLVVIAIIALLMGILMPALARVRQIAYRMVCGTNIAGIGKAILIYANDNQEEFPRAGGKSSHWGTTGIITQWDAVAQKDAFGGVTTGANATITSCLYLLVKYADVTPKQFVCKGDVGTKIFKLSDMTTISTTALQEADAWDFGVPAAMVGSTPPGNFCSYAYHMPLAPTGNTTSFPLAAVSNPSSPIIADRNPHLDKNAESYLKDTTDSTNDPDYKDWGSGIEEYKDKNKKANAAAHQREGQNVLFNDGHVSFEKYPNVGIENDNIYFCWSSYDSSTPNVPAVQEKQAGIAGDIVSAAACWYPISNIPGLKRPACDKDAFLVNEQQGRR